jgi:hypothetical protein
MAGRPRRACSAGSGCIEKASIASGVTRAGNEEALGFFTHHGMGVSTEGRGKDGAMVDDE